MLRYCDGKVTVGVTAISRQRHGMVTGGGRVVVGVATLLR